DLDVGDRVKSCHSFPLNWSPEVCPDLPTEWRSIELQGRRKLSVVHASQIIFRINISRTTKEELHKGVETTGTQRINNASKRNLDREQIRVRNGHKLEVVWE